MRSLLTVKLERDNKYAAYLKLINGILALTPRELRVLAAFMELNQNYPCSSADRRTVKAALGILNVNVYVKLFKDRGLIKKEPSSDRYVPSPIILPPEKGVRIDIQWT
jgi:hypothetical protein